MFSLRSESFDLTKNSSRSFVRPKLVRLWALNTQTARKVVLSTLASLMYREVVLFTSSSIQDLFDLTSKGFVLEEGLSVQEPGLIDDITCATCTVKL